jgi:uncharacterized protein YpmB
MGITQKGEGGYVMTIEVSYIISAISVAFAIYFGLSNNKRSQNSEAKSEATQLTTVIVKLETIGNGIAEIKNEISSIKKDSKEDHERIIKLEESTKSAHKRLDICEKYCKRYMEGENEEK